MSIKKTASKKPEKKTKDECADCPAKDFCEDEKNIYRLKDKKAQSKAKKNFEAKIGSNLDDIFSLINNKGNDGNITREIIETDKDFDYLLPLIDEFSKKVYATGFVGKINVETTSQEELDKMKDAHFCSHCGKKMIERDAPAEQYRKLVGGMFGTLRYDAFDKKTGKKLFIKEAICPKWKGETLFRTEKHDRYSIGKAFTK